MRCLRRRTGTARACAPTVYVKTLYRIGGQDYCRHHVIRAAVAAGVIAEVKPGTGLVAATHLGALSAEYDQYRQR